MQKDRISYNVMYNVGAVRSSVWLHMYNFFTRNSPIHINGKNIARAAFTQSQSGRFTGLRRLVTSFFLKFANIEITLNNNNN
jgi:hypothetical protein